jgi:hypothetical protein
MSSFFTFTDSDGYHSMQEFQSGGAWRSGQMTFRFSDSEASLFCGPSESFPAEKAGRRQNIILLYLEEIGV